MDTIVNFLYATLSASALSSDTSLILTTGHGARFGNSFPFDVVVYDPAYANAALAYHANKAEIIRVTARSTDTLTVTRAQQSTTAIAFSSSWIVIQAPTQDLMSQVIPNSLVTTRGDIITRGASAPQRLALGTTGLFLSSDGTDAVWEGVGGGDCWHSDTTDTERWMCPGVTSLANKTPSVNRMYAMAFFVSQACTVTQMSINVATGGASSGVRVGIYLSKSESNIYPGTLLVDSGELDTTSTGVKSATVSQVLTANRWHWWAFLCKATAPVVSGVGGYAANVGVDTSFGMGNNLYVSQTYGALPSTFPGSPTFNTSGTFPVVAFKLSGLT